MMTMFNAVLLTTCTVPPLAVIGRVLLITTPVAVTLLAVTGGARITGVLWSVLEGWFTPKRKVLVAKGLNFVSWISIGNILLILMLYIFTPTFIPGEVNACLQPV